MSAVHASEAFADIPTIEDGRAALALAKRYVRGGAAALLPG
jgi:hypothetical protein